MITSKAQVLPLEEAPTQATTSEIADLKIMVEALMHIKCERCWHRREDIGANAQYPELCGRCVENVSGQAEKRCYA